MYGLRDLPGAEALARLGKNDEGLMSFDKENEGDLEETEVFEDRDSGDFAKKYRGERAK